MNNNRSRRDPWNGDGSRDMEAATITYPEMASQQQSQRNETIGYSTNVYGGIRSNDAQTITSGGRLQSQIPMPLTDPSINVSYDTENTISVDQTGDYEVQYSLVASPSLPVTLTAALRLDGSDIPTTVMSRPLGANTSSELVGSAILSLHAGDELDMAISTNLGADITLGRGLNAYIILKRLDV